MPTVEEIIVIAPNYPGGGGAGTEYGNGWSTYDVDEFQILQNMGWYPPSHTVKISVEEENLEDAQEARDRLAEHISRIDPLINGLTGSGSITLSKTLVGESMNYTTILYSHIKDRWENAHFTITDVNYGTARGGQAILTPATGLSELKASISTIMGYSAPGYTDDRGMNYYLLHELAHITNPMFAVNIKNTHDYVNINGNYNGYDQSTYFENVEKDANWVSLDMANALGLPILSPPPYGF